MVEDKANRKLAAVISSYAMPLLEGCNTVEKGSLRMIGQTKPVPFITVFATDRVSKELGKKVQAALFAVVEDVDLLKALESQRGFVEMPSVPRPSPRSSVPLPSPLSPLPRMARLARRQSRRDRHPFAEGASRVADVSLDKTAHGHGLGGHRRHRMPT